MLASVDSIQFATHHLTATARRLLGSTSNLCATRTNETIHRYRDSLFERELQEQRQSMPRFEKVDVSVQDPFVSRTSFSFRPTCAQEDKEKESSSNKDVVHLRMNRYMSTPYDCALHVSSELAKRSVLALVNGQPWDMHCPLDSSSKQFELKFIHFKESDARRCEIVNKAYVRSCALILGYLLETCFKPEYYVELCSFPSTSLSALYIVYDTRLNLGKSSWKPRPEELRCMSVQAYKIRDESLRFDSLDVSFTLAREMFKDNSMKLQQLDCIEHRRSGSQMKSSPGVGNRETGENRIRLYRCGKYVDICQGPCIADTSHIGRFEVAAIHPIDTSSYGTLDRVQALSIPSQLHLHYWTFEWLLRRAAKPCYAMLPSLNARVKVENTITQPV